MLACPLSASAQAALTPTAPTSPLRLVDILLLTALACLIYLAYRLWQQLARARAQQDAQAQLLRRVLELQELRDLEAAASLPADTQVPPESLRHHLIHGIEDLRAQLSQHRLTFEGLQEAQIMSISRLEEIRKEMRESVQQLAQEKGAADVRAQQRQHKETVTGLERIHVTQSGLISALEALKASERRDSALLAEVRAAILQINSRVTELLESDASLDPTVIDAPERRAVLVDPSASGQESGGITLSHTLQMIQGFVELQQTVDTLTDRINSIAMRSNEVPAQLDPFSTDQIERIEDRLKQLEEVTGALYAVESHTHAMAERLSGLEREVGLVLSARPQRRANEAESPYDAVLAREYYTNLQKLVRVLIKNDKASSYALEGIQYLHESLQLQEALCEVLSSAEFAIRLSPAAIEEHLLRPLVRQLKGEPLPAAASPRDRQPSGERPTHSHRGRWEDADALLRVPSEDDEEASRTAS